MKVLFLILLSIPFFATADEEVKLIKGSKNLPTEINLIFQSFQYPSPTKESYQLLLPHAFNIETYAKLVSKEELFFTAKSEIYKSLLKIGSSTKNIVNPDDLKKLREARKKSSDPFVNWLLGSMISDLDSVFNSPGYKDYLLLRDNPKNLKSDSKKAAKKLSILSKFYNLFSLENPDNTKNEITFYMEEALKGVEEALFLIASETRFEALPKKINDAKNLTYFVIEGYKPVDEKTMGRTKSVEEIIDGAENLEQEAEIPNLPKPSAENWIEEESTPFDIKKLPKPTGDAEWLQDI